MRTTKEISDNIINQLQAALNQSIPLLPKSFNRVLSKAIAAVLVTLFKYADWIGLQQLVASASGQETTILGKKVTPLVFWGELIGAGRPTEATRAEIVVTVTVLNQTGELPTGQQLVGKSNGVTYLSTTSTALDAPTVQIVARAVSDQSGGGGRGTVGNLVDGAAVSFANPIDNVQRDAVVASQAVTGADAEPTEVYRQRVVDRFQKRPQGGAYADYQQWAEGVPGIINAYPYTGDPGQVDVYAEATPASSGSADGIPTNAQLEAVLNAINFDDDGLAKRRNASAWPNVYPITRTGFDVDVSGITGVDDLAATRAEVAAAVREYFLQAAPYIPGLSVPPRRDRLTSTRLSAIVEDIVTARGGFFTSARFTVSGTAANLQAYALAEGEKTKASTVGFS